jgi:hypothetical protein
LIKISRKIFRHSLVTEVGGWLLAAGHCALAGNGQPTLKRIAATIIRNAKMVRPWLERFGRNSNGKRIKPKRSNVKKQLACAMTKQPNSNGRSHGAMPVKKKGNGWSQSKTKTNATLKQKT